MSTESIKYVVDLAGNMDKKLTEIIANQKTLNEEIDKTKRKTKEIGGSGTLDNAKNGFNTLKNSAMMAAAAIAGIGYSMISLARQNAGLEQNNRALMISSGSSMEYLKNLEFLNEMQRKFGTNIETSRDGLMSFSAATKGTALQGDKTRKIFQAVTQASGALGLSADKQGLTFMALSQIASKGVVSMEELRGQLGESLPGALQVAARSMNMTTAEFQKMVGEGKLLATDFLPKFAEELQKTFSGGFDPDSMTNVLTKWDNAWKTMAENAGMYFKDAMSAAANGATLLSTKFQKQVLNDNIENTLASFEADKNILFSDATTYGYLSEKYKNKYGEDIGTSAGRGNIQSKIMNTSVIPDLQKSLDAERMRADTWLSMSVKKYAKYMNNDPFFKGYSLEQFAAHPNLNDEDTGTGGFEFNKYKESLKMISTQKKDLDKLKSEFPELSKPGDSQKITTELDKFGGTTITARAPQTFNITINELIGVNEMNNVTNMKEVGATAGNAILDELMKAVAQVKMAQ